MENFALIKIVFLEKHSLRGKYQEDTTVTKISPVFTFTYLKRFNKVL